MLFVPCGLCSDYAAGYVISGGVVVPLLPAWTLASLTDSVFLQRYLLEVGMSGVLDTADGRCVPEALVVSMATPVEGSCPGGGVKP